MDSDFWTSRLAAAKRQYALQHQHQNRLNIDDFEVEDDQVRPDFPCPYCYEDFDIASLCSHLEDEHSCESKVTIPAIEWCLKFNFLKFGYVNELQRPFRKTMKSRFPEYCTAVTAAQFRNGYRRMLYYLQRRRRLRRVAIPNSQALSLLGRDLREAHLQVLLGGGGYRSNSSSVSNATTDPFLSSLILNFPTSEAEEISKSVVTSAEDTAAKNAAPTHMWKTSFDPSLSCEERERRMKQATGRAGFVQDLLLSILSSD
ncbi:hypothetical protein EZV62_026749 [Acer yangbiense]|uniref:Drought induced 19 protein type zinc-binding domain-containing protein n=1 Tax=Acer yangbiense TaxID=1000413 RepID=A0A5C7GSA8_9ROSI|nr:hypothetical protein EZV62_026749 [Acer yangbiense]